MAPQVGLGTDVSGGFSISMLTAIQHASVASKLVTLHHPCPSDASFASKHLSISTLLYLATQGGADVCNISTRTGSLDPGKAFDALVVSVVDSAGNPAVWGSDLDRELGINRWKAEEGGMRKTEAEKQKEELEAMLERFMFCGDDRNIRRVYVQGRFIGGKEFNA